MAPVMSKPKTPPKNPEAERPNLMMKMQEISGAKGVGSGGWAEGKTQGRRGQGDIHDDEEDDDGDDGDDGDDDDEEEYAMMTDK